MNGKLQWCQIENQQSPIYVVNSYFSRRPDGVLRVLPQLSPLESSLPYQRASNEALYDPVVPEGVSKIQQVKVKTPKVT